MNTVLIALSVSCLSAQQDNMHMASYAIQAADEVTARMPLDDIYWKYAKTNGPKKGSAEAELVKYKKARDQYDAIIKAIKTEPCFPRPIRMSLVIKSAKQDDQGKIHLHGTFQAYAKMVYEYRTKDESELIDAYEKETEGLIAEFTARMEQETIPEKEKRRHARRIENRNSDFDRWEDELALMAQPRKDHLELVTIDIVIPSAMAETLHVDKLMQAKRVLITMHVEKIDLKEPLKDLNEPARIGLLSGPATDIVQYMKKE